MEDQDDVVETMREDAVEVMTTAQLVGTSVDGGDASEEEEKASGDESTGRGGVPHRPALNFRRTLTSWRRKRRTMATKKSSST